MMGVRKGPLMTIYVRFQGPAGTRAFGPRPADADDTALCWACGEGFKAGDYTTLVPLGPGADEEAQGKAREGRWYNAVALEVHWACAGHDPQLLD